MLKAKYEITNTGTSIVLLSYQNYGDGMWVYQSTLLPGQTKHIWCNDGTLSYSKQAKIKITKLSTDVCGVTPTPEILINAIITENVEYLDIGDGEYLQYID